MVFIVAGSRCDPPGSRAELKYNAFIVVGFGVSCLELISKHDARRRGQNQAGEDPKGINSLSRFHLLCAQASATGRPGAPRGGDDH